MKRTMLVAKLWKDIVPGDKLFVWTEEDGKWRTYETYVVDSVEVAKTNKKALMVRMVEETTGLAIRFCSSKRSLVDGDTIDLTGCSDVSPYYVFTDLTALYLHAIEIYEGRVKNNMEKLVAMKADLEVFCTLRRQEKQLN